MKRFLQIFLLLVLVSCSAGKVDYNLPEETYIVTVKKGADGFFKHRLASHIHPNFVRAGARAFARRGDDCDPFHPNLLLRKGPKRPAFW